MQVSLKPKDIAPQLVHLFSFDLKESKNINVKRNNMRGIRNKRSMILPRKLRKKLIPTIGITNIAIRE